MSPAIRTSLASACAPDTSLGDRALDGQIHLALGVVQLALLAQKFGLGPLSLLQLFISLLQQRMERCDFVCLRRDFVLKI